MRKSYRPKAYIDIDLDNKPTFSHKTVYVNLNELGKSNNNPPAQIFGGRVSMSRGDQNPRRYPQPMACECPIHASVEVKIG